MINRFSTLLPPPNLTGALHLGHMWNAILQDGLVRYYSRRVGQNNWYWGFGVDHAGISLQIKVEESLRNEGIDKVALSPEEFQKKLWEWKDFYDARITHQYSQLGLALPMDEKRFTLDEASVNHVIDVFGRLYKEKLIYRADRLVNWDPVIKTAISDTEVEYRPATIKLYRIKYSVGGEDLIISTTRPETIFGDVALFVNPADERYTHLVGKNARIPLTDREIPILADSYVDADFGTGVLKCTPAHDFADAELARRHKLPNVIAFDLEMKMLEGPYVGLNKDEAKKKLIEDLKQKGLVEMDNYKTNLSYSSRSGAIIEPMLSKQWFVKSSVLAHRALVYWEKNPESLVFIKESRAEEFKHMLENMEDWCISRQLEWGIRLPIYFDDQNNPSLIPSEKRVQSTDVLDTWFSSSLWPSIVFENLQEFLPLSIMVSGKDILLLWISRMVFMHFYVHKRFPFRKVFLHGLLVDDSNKKMSKSSNNGVDPLELIKEHPISTVRLFFFSHTNQDNNITFSVQKLEYYKKVLHKLKHANGLINHQISNGNLGTPEGLTANDRNILVYLGELEERLADLYDNCRFGLIASDVMNFVRDRFCNRYLELYKILNKHKKNDVAFLKYIWNRMLILMEPIIPEFVQECGIDNSLEFSWEGFEPIQMNWFFEYRNTFEAIRKRLDLPANEELKVELFGDECLDRAEMVEYLGYINHKVIRVGLARDVVSATNTISFAVYDGEFPFFAAIHVDPDTLKKYLDMIMEEKKWLTDEIKFLRQRMKQFGPSTPQNLFNEVSAKIRRYERDLMFYENNYRI